MLSTKSFFVRFLREHELKIDVVNYTNFTNTVTMTFHFANRSLKNTNTIQMVYARDSPLIKKC